MTGRSIEYVALQYSPDIFSSAGHPVAVVFRYLDTGASRFCVRQHTNWRSVVPSSEWEYIEDVLSEFSQPQRVLDESDFQRISEMSTSVLRTAATGVCTEEELDQLVS